MEDSGSIFPPEDFRKSEVGQFEYEISAQQNIFRLYISMGIAFGVHIVKPIHHLMEVSASDFLRKLASFGDEVEQLAPAHVLENDGKTGEGALILSFVGCILSNIDQAD